MSISHPASTGIDLDSWENYVAQNPAIAAEPAVTYCLPIIGKNETAIAITATCRKQAEKSFDCIK